MRKIHAAMLSASLLLSATQSFAGSGSSQYDPVLPDVIQPGYGSVSGQAVAAVFVFSSANSGLWFDPPMIDAFEIMVSSTYFTKVTAPLGVNGLQLLVNNQIVDDNFGDGESYIFAAQVYSFFVRNIHPTVDPASPSLPTALPLKLDFVAPSTTMTWVALSSAVPESDVYLLMIGGLAALGLLKRRR